MLPPPPIRGVFRTDLRARAAYAEGAGIYRILPEAVCVPADRQDVVSLVALGRRPIAYRWFPAEPAARWAAETWARASWWI